jgi:ankyrin repeat protein
MNSNFFHQILRMLNLVFILAMLFTQCESCKKDPKGILVKSYNKVPTIQDMVQDAYDKDLPFLATILTQVQNYDATNKDIVDINASDTNSHNETALHQAILHFDSTKSLEAVNQLILGGADVNAKASNHVTPLHLAVQKEHKDLVELLLDNGANLEDATTNLQRRPIHIAADQSNPAIMQLLIDRGAIIDATAYKGATALHIAASFGNLETVKLLHAKGADIDNQDQDELIPLHLAAYKGRVEVIEYLVQNNANYRTRAATFIAPLHLAIYGGYVAAVEKLLQLDSNPKTYIELEAENKSRPLHIAAYKAHAGIVSLLINKGADMDAQDRDGFTALHWAALKGYPAVVQVLLAKGANKKLENKKYKHTPLEVAKIALTKLKVQEHKKEAYKEVIRLLKGKK